MIKGCNSTHWWIDDDGEVQSETYNGKKKRQGRPVFPGKTEEIKRYISDYKRWHQYLESSIGTGVGNTLQYIDSELILFVLREANKADIPVLPVHDELVFPQNHKYFIYIALMDAFSDVLGEAGQFGVLKVKEKCLVSETVTVKAVELDLNTEAV